jgi:cytoskeletal protein RodZ
MNDGSVVQHTSRQQGDNGYSLSAEERKRLEEMAVRDPDELLAPSRSSFLTWAAVVSILCHVAVLAATSAAVFSDWRQYGRKSPATNRAEKKQALDDAKQAERDAKMAAQRESAAKAATADGGPGDAPPAETPSTADETSSPDDNDREKPPESFNIDDIDLDL